MEKKKLDYNVAQLKDEIYFVERHLIPYLTAQLAEARVKLETLKGKYDAHRLNKANRKQ